MNKKLKPTCPDCGAPVGERHRDGCDVERCPHCGWSALGCAHFHADDPRRQVLTGKWPGEDDCERLDFFVNGDKDFPDLSPVHRLCLGCGHGTLGAEAVIKLFRGHRCHVQGTGHRGKRFAYLWKHQHNIASLPRSVIAWLRRPRNRGISGCCKKWPRLGGIWPAKRSERKRPKRASSLYRLFGHAHPRDDSTPAPSGGAWPSTVHSGQFARVPDTPSRSVCTGPTCPCGIP
jgi:hypothetical protein